MVSGVEGGGAGRGGVGRGGTRGGRRGGGRGAAARAGGGCRRGRARVRGAGGPAPAVAGAAVRVVVLAARRGCFLARACARALRPRAARCARARSRAASPCRRVAPHGSARRAARPRRGGTRGAGATGAAAAAGSRGGGGDRRGQSTTRATIAGSAARRATFPQRTRRSSESDGMNAVGIGRSEFAPCYRAPPLMAAPAPIYDLMVLLDTTAPDDQRAKILADAEAMITSGGSVVSKHDWGPRTMAYEIRHKTDAEYHLIQFHGNAAAAGEPPAHAADHGRRRALPDHQARARHAGPAAEARARAGRAGRSARRGLRRAGPRSAARAATWPPFAPRCGPFCCQARSLRDDSATKERRIRRVRGSRRNPGLHSPQQSSDAFAPPRKEPFRAWPRRTSTG